MGNNMVNCSYFYSLVLVVLGQQFVFVGGQRKGITKSFLIRPLNDSSHLDDWYRVLPPADRIWGHPRPHGSISEMMGMVAHREANFAIAGFAINGKRENVIDFAVPYCQVSLGIYTKAPNEKNRALAVLSSFTQQVWMSLLLVTLAMGPILTIQGQISKMYLSDKPRKGLSNLSLKVFRNVVNQENHLPTQQWPQRYLFCAWYIFCQLVSDRRMITIGLMLLLNLPLTSQQPVTQQILSNKSVRFVDNSIPDTGSLMSHIIETQMKGCHTLYVTEEGESRISWSLLSSLRENLIPRVFLNLKVISLHPRNEIFEEIHKGEKYVTCRVFVFDLSGSTDSRLILKFMENLQFFLVRHTSAVFIGPRSFLHETLMSPSLWNTIKAMYLVVEETSNYDIGGLNVSKHSSRSFPVAIYSRCLYCNESNPGIRLVDVWNSKSNFVWAVSLFPDQFRDMLGHELSIVQNDAYPIISFTRNSDEISTTVTPRDSIDVRLLRAIAKALNFTYVMRVPWDNQWGSTTDSGNWTGMVGTLQHHKADFGMTLNYLISRMKVVDYSWGYMLEPHNIIMSKPLPPQPYLAIIRPFPGDIWIYVAMSTALAVILLWILQFIWSKVSNEQALRFDTLMLNTVSTVFEEPASKLPSNTSSLMFLGWWWIFCVFITSMYKSSLVSHLSVPGKSKAFDSIAELIEADGWTWGIQNSHTSEYLYLKTNPDPVIQRFYEELEIMELELQVKKILKGHHAFFDNKYVFMSSDAAIANTHRGYSPFYYSKEEYFRNGQGWAFRQNAPFIHAIDIKIHNILEAGIFDRWVNELVGTKDDDGGQSNTIDDEKSSDATENMDGGSQNVVLSLSHLQSAFFVLVLGYLASSLTFVCEAISEWRRWHGIVLRFCNKVFR